MIPAHGGDMNAVSREHGIPVAELVDFSASINPFGPPLSALARLERESADVANLARYPDPRYVELRSTLAARFGVPLACLTIANGSAAMIGEWVRPRACFRCRRSASSNMRSKRQGARWSIFRWTALLASGSTRMRSAGP
jgi:hypothetical protein